VGHGAADPRGVGDCGALGDVGFVDQPESGAVVDIGRVAPPGGRLNVQG
jgi:hypothetical protein